MVDWTRLLSFNKSLKKNITLFNQTPIGEHKVSSHDFILILFNQFKKLKYSSVWLESNKFGMNDIRYQVFARVESATLVYEQNIISSVNNYQSFIKAGLAHGYGEDFIVDHVIRTREVTCRTSFIDSIYLVLDHFYEILRTSHHIATTGRNKQKEFVELLKGLALENKSISRKIILQEIVNDLPKNLANLAPIFVDNNSSSISYTQVHDYLTLIRNSLHNNGFTNKSMPNFKVGPFDFINIHKDSYLYCLGTSHIVLLIYCTLKILEDICHESANRIPALIKDPFMQILSDKLTASNNRVARSISLPAPAPPSI